MQSDEDLRPEDSIVLDESSQSLEQVRLSSSFDAAVESSRELDLPSTSSPLAQRIARSRGASSGSSKLLASRQPSDELAFVKVVADFSRITSSQHQLFEHKLSSLLLLGCDFLDADYAFLTKSDKHHSRIIACEAQLDGKSATLGFVPGATLSCVDAVFPESQRTSLIALEELNDSLDPAEFSGGAAISHPISIAEETVGLLSFWNQHSRIERYDESEVLYVKMLSRWISAEISHKKVRDALTRRMEFEQLLSGVSLKFISQGPTEVDRGMQDALGQIAKFANVDLSYIFLFKDEDKRMDITHCWLADDTQPDFRMSDIEVSKYQWAMEQILNRKTVFIEELSDIPESAPAVLRFCQAQGVRSAIMVPMVHGGVPIGLVGFAVRNRREQFDVQSRTLLQMVGSTFASAVQYKRAQESLSHLEAQMRHAQKLESLGVLAGGIAHDFNNLLMGIMGNASIALEQLESDSPANLSLSRIERISQHAAELTNQLLAYSGQGKFFIETINLSSIVDEMVDLLEAAKSKKHTLQCNFASDLPTIEGDATQISQVIMNLITNASEAIGEGKGTITVNTGLVAVDKEYLMDTFLCEDTPEGVYTYLRVADDGCGMDSETVSRIFDPFFTTKFTGRGLGLAAVLGIVRSHKGTLKVHSKPGEGTIITVVFPCAEHQSILQSSSDELGKSSRQDNEHGVVLVVDDEETVRTVVSASLQQLGFEVLEAENGTKALELYQAEHERIEFVVLDMSMPDMDGVQVYRRLEASDGNAQVVMMSGYSEREFENSFTGNQFGGFIQKPFRPKTLASRIEELRQGTLKL